MMLKKSSIRKNSNQPIELLCHKYGKIVGRFREPKFLTKLLNYLEKRKMLKKKSNVDTKGAFNIAKGLLAAFSRTKAPVLN